jgi:hypothetical protein
VPKNSRPSRGKKVFSLGASQAETDWLLHSAFFESVEYLACESQDDRRCFLIGRTGGGKSAALKQLESEHPEHVVRINPENLSLPYITDLGVIRYLNSLNVHLDSLFAALWRHVLLVEIIRHRYKVDSPEAKRNFLQNLREKIQRDPSKMAALEYLDTFEGKFWCTADERVRDITEKFQEQIAAEAKAQFGITDLAEAGGSISSSLGHTREQRAEYAARFQRIVNENQLARLNKMITVLDDHILDDQHFTYVIIDDLDREWVDEQVANDLILFLFRTVQDLVSRVKNLKVLVALRTNIFEQLNFSTKVGAQEEKLRSLILNMQWSREDLHALLDQRVEAAAHRAELKYETVAEILPNTNRNRGNPLDYILDRTLLRPRDAIAFLNQGIRAAPGKTRLAWSDIYVAEQTYSRDRLLALRDEWKDPYPGLEAVFELFRRKPMPMNKKDFTICLEEAMLLPANRENFRGTVWMTEMSRVMLFESGDQDWLDLFRPLTELLFRIGFIGFKPETNSTALYVYDDSKYASVGTKLGATEWFVVHPAFHLALDIDETPAGRVEHQ